MTASPLTATAATPTTPASLVSEERLRSLMRLDVPATAVAGLVIAFAPETSYGDLPTWLGRVTGAVLVAMAADLAWGSTWRGRRLRMAGAMFAVLAWAWVAGTVVLVALPVLPASSDVAMGVIGAVTAAFAVGYTRLVRALR